MLKQVALEGLPASADTHHHMLVVQHLLEGHRIRVTSDVLSRAELSQAQPSSAETFLLFKELLSFH